MRKGSREKPSQDRGNFVSEWFGYRVYPTVWSASAPLADQRAGRCPFLSAVLGEQKECVKPPASSGICTISSASNGPRQDWLVCPYRALDQTLMRDATRRLFGDSGRGDLSPLPAPALVRSAVREDAAARVMRGETVIIYFQDKLGGEISIPPTDRSPELAFDITLVEVSFTSGRMDVGRYGILEVQTMDFHGSYRHAVGNLKDALRLHGSRFPHVLQENQGWLSDHVEGPNIANVFKRTS